MLTAEWYNLKWYRISFHCIPITLNLIKICYMFWKIKVRAGQTFLTIYMSSFYVPHLKHMKTYNMWCNFYLIQYQTGLVFDTVIFIYVSPDGWQFYLRACWNATVLSTQQIKGRAISYICNDNSSCILTLTHQPLILK